MGKRTIPLAWMVTLLLAVAAFSVGAFAADLIIGNRQRTGLDVIHRSRWGSLLPHLFLDHGV